ncbi:malonyl-CoA decarboxylase [Breoghania sp.]|uniref:malonyl-CoA decarboxylase n=1 Tax=Breoghania sp. TaxID=2065378 RepID=UPI002AA822CB|nr:malonyl-CoA decarboxylase [Breoghania sp.]
MSNEQPSETGRMTMLQDMLSALVSRGARLMEGRGGAQSPQDLHTLCEALLSSRGEASGVALASEILRGFDTLDIEARKEFLTGLAEPYDPDADRVEKAAASYRENGTNEALAELIAASEPPRQELLRRLNLAPGGTAALVHMRETLLTLLPDNPALERVDADFGRLFASWFNRGFLVLRHIDWQTPAHILEKIIEYEAVHAIDNWDELRRRVQPADRRCFAFFHPSMPDEPLIFVEVALSREIPSSIQTLLSEDREILSPDKATTATFYSISNCQTGLRGVSFGNFLIKQVAEDLAHEIPSLKTFVTLSPVPGLMRWMRQQAETDANGRAAQALATMATPDWRLDADTAGKLEPLIKGLTADYFLSAKRPDGQPLDPVARFHLGNGAMLRQIDWLGDTSPKGLTQSAGVMVNYLYDLSEVETNHETYAARREITAARAVRSLASANDKKVRKAENGKKDTA